MSMQMKATEQYFSVAFFLAIFANWTFQNSVEFVPVGLAFSFKVNSLSNTQSKKSTILCLMLQPEFSINQIIP